MGNLMGKNGKGFAANERARISGSALFLQKQLYIVLHVLHRGVVFNQQAQFALRVLDHHVAGMVDQRLRG